MARAIYLHGSSSTLGITIHIQPNPLLYPMGFLDKFFGKKHGDPVTSKALPARSVPGALVASDQKGTVLYNMLTPHMQQFMGKCVGALKKVGIPAKGTAQFSIFIGERRLQLRLDSYYAPSDDPQLVDRVVEAAKKHTNRA